MKSRRLVVAVGAAALAAIIAASLAWAAFTDRKTNPQTLQAASTWPVPLRMASGSYVGNGTKPRAITGVPFRPDVVIVRGDTNQVPIARTSTMPDGTSKRLVGGNALETDNINSLDANGFTIGSDNRVNDVGKVFHWVAMKVGPGSLTVGSYAGDGGASRSIAGVGFSPEYVAVLDAGNARAVQRYAGMSRAFQFDADTGTTSRITSLDAGGFTVGNAVETNKAGTTYHYYALNEAPGSVDVNSYTGDGSDSRNISGIGFQPGYVSIRADSTATARTGAHRFASQTGDSTFAFGGNPAVPNLIQTLQAEGFQVGSDPIVNASGVGQYYLALRNTADACQQSGTYTLTNPVDTWLDQNAPTAVKATDTGLRVRSRNGDDNRRALVRFTLPVLDPGCEIKLAKFALTATGAKPGRTLHLVLINAAWTDTSATWNNQPPTTGTPLPASSPAANGATAQWDVTAQVRDMYTGTLTNQGWLVKDSNESDPNGQEQVFASKENTNDPRPQLSLTIGAP